MSVYVDTFRSGRFACHMAADTHDELIAMARAIGVQEKWIQKPGTPSEHFDLYPSKRALAVKNGAIEVDPRDIVRLIRRKRGQE